MRNLSIGLLATIILSAGLFSGCPGDDCLPACSGKSCGDDGCGGSCGACDTPPPGVCYTGEGECVSGQCRYFTEPDGTSCSDGEYCDGEETCQAGECREGSEVECLQPDNTCLHAYCDEATASCLEEVLSDGAACSDWDPCTEGDSCLGGVCQPGVEVCQADVVILMYLAADNDLDEDIVGNWQAMENANVDDFGWLRVFVLMDRAYNAVWTDTRFYELHNGYSLELDGPNLGLTIDGFEELNMAEGATVTNFIRDAKEIAGADASYFLLLLDHGDGWWKKKDVPPATRGCCYDETSGDDYLAQLELSEAVRSQGLDLIGFDACLQGMAEVAYEHRDDAYVLIGSQELEGAWGWDYQNLLRDFGTSNDPSPENFAVLAVDTYLELALFNQDQTATLAAYDLLGMYDLADACSDMATALTNLSTGEFDDLCAQLDWYGCEGGECEEYADLYRLAELAKGVDPANAAVYDQVMTAVSNVVFYEQHGSYHPDAHGMSVFYACYYYPYPEYSDNTWAIATGWGDMVNSH